MNNKTVAAYPVRMLASGGWNWNADYLMSDGTVKTLNIEERDAALAVLTPAADTQAGRPQAD